MRTKKVRHVSEHFTLAGDDISAVATGCDYIVPAPRAMRRLSRAVSIPYAVTHRATGDVADGRRRMRARVAVVGWRKAKKDFVRFAEDARRVRLRLRDLVCERARS